MSKSRKLIALAAVAVIAAAGVGFAVAQSSQRPTSPAAPPAVKKAGLGRIAHADEIKAWDTDVRPDGQGLPAGRGNVKQGEEVYQAQCAACHGEFGEGVGRLPMLAGGRGSLKHEQPDKTVGSFWPFASTAFDYVKRAMPYGNARSLTDDEVYAVTAYIMFLNDFVNEEFELNHGNFTSVKLPNVDGFYDDDRETTEKHFWRQEPCMTKCKPEPAKITGRARILDVTPDSKSGPKVD